MIMPPLSPTEAAPTRQETKPALLVRFTWMALLGALACWLIAGQARADGPVPAEPSRPAAAPSVSAKSPGASTLRPQTRYTVRKQIESIEPVSWLERYGTVATRELGR